MAAELLLGRDADTVARLRRELLVLRRERAALRARFLPPGRLPAVLSLPPQESVVVSVLLANSEVTHELMWQALFHDADPESPPLDKTVDVLICKARKRLSSHEIFIETFARRGWRMKHRLKSI